MLSVLCSAVMSDARWRLAWRLLFLLLITMISWLAFSPLPPVGVDLGWDKANHFVAFATLAFVGLQCLRPGRRRRWAVVLALLAYGVLIELIQSHVPGRAADARDVLADMIGVAIGLAAHMLVLRCLPRPAPLSRR